MKRKCQNFIVLVYTEMAPVSEGRSDMVTGRMGGLARLRGTAVGLRCWSWVLFAVTSQHVAPFSCNLHQNQETASGKGSSFMFPCDTPKIILYCILKGMDL